MRLMLGGCLAAYAMVLVVVLVNPSPAVGSGMVTHVASLFEWFGAPAAFLMRARIEFGLNVLAFLPLSLLGSLLRPAVSVSGWTAAGFFGSLLVEVVQTLQPDRSATHADVVANTLGAALGAMLAWAALHRTRQ